jgi:hypothetical protein
MPRNDLDMLVDAEFFMRIASVARRVARLPEVIARYRVHSTGVTATTARDGRFVGELRRLPEIAATHPRVVASMLDVVREQVARELYSAGVSAFVGADPAVGRSMIVEAGQRWRPLTRESIYAIDRALITLGPVGVSIGRRLHRDRVPKGSTARRVAGGAS